MPMKGEYHFRRLILKIKKDSMSITGTQETNFLRSHSLLMSIRRIDSQAIFDTTIKDIDSKCQWHH